MDFKMFMQGEDLLPNTLDESAVAGESAVEVQHKVGKLQKLESGDVHLKHGVIPLLAPPGRLSSRDA
jgi:hypothetical protein